MRETVVSAQRVGLGVELELEDEEIIREGGNCGGDRADIGEEDIGMGAVGIGV